MKKINNFSEGYKKLFSLSPDGFVIIENGVYVDCNNATLKLLKTNRKSYVIGKTTLDISPDYQYNGMKSAVYLEKVIDDFSKNKSLKFEWTHQCYDGSLVIVMVNLISIKIEKKNYLFGTFRDITDKKKTEEELLTFRTISEQSNYGTSYSDLDGNILYTNEAFAQMHGYTKKELTGKNITIFMHEDIKDIHDIIKLVSVGNGFDIRENVHIRKDGSTFPALMTGQLIRDENDNPKYISATALDITQLKFQEQEIRNLNQNLENLVKTRTLQLAESNSSLRKEIEDRKKAVSELKIKTIELESFLNITPDLLSIADTTGKIIRVNNSWERIMGYKPDQLKNSNFFDLIHPDDIKPTIDAVNNFRGSQGSENFKNRCRTYSGEYKYLEWITVYQGELMYSAARDITNHIMLEDSLKESIRQEKILNEMKTKFVSIASHEFRTPLANIMLSVEMLQTFRKTLTTGQSEEKLNNILMQVSYLDSIVSNVLNLSKIQEGKIKPELKKGDLVNFCRMLTNDFNDDLMPRNKITFKSEFSGLIIKFDEKLLMQALQNLITNSIKYSEQDPLIEIDLYKLENEYILSIKDNGIGIPDDDQAFVFQAFFRAKNVKNIRGNGLGLNIVKESLKLLGWDISLSSKLNEGTIFFIVIPEVSF
jgi:PAS domain S-box-containing protein